MLPSMLSARMYSLDRSDDARTVDFFAAKCAES